MERQTITVDISPHRGMVPQLRVSQGDIGRPLGVYIMQDGAALDCSSYTADLYVLKADGNYYVVHVTVDSTETNLVTWETAEQETPVAGECAAQIRIMHGGDDIGTARFVEYVEASPGFCGAGSESAVESLEEYVRQAAESASTASGAATTATGAASSAAADAQTASGAATTATGAAETASSAAETAADAAETAQDVLDSIPADYSEMSADVSSLKSAFDDFVNAESDETTINDWTAYADTNNPTGWATGYYNSSTGEYTSSNVYIRTLRGYEIDCGDATIFEATAPTGYNIAAYEYDEEMSFIERHGVQGNDGTPHIKFVFTKGHKFRLSIGRFANQDDSTAHLNSEFLSTCVVKLTTLKSETALTRIEKVAIYPTASGSIASFPDGADGMAIKELKVGIEPVQDLHGYDYPWPAGGGKNLLRNSATSGSSNGITWTVNANGSIAFSGTASADVNISINNVNSQGYVPIGSGTITLVQNNGASYNPSISGLNFQTDIYADGTKMNTLGNSTPTRQYTGVITAGTSRLHIDSGTVIPSGTVFYPMIEIGSTPTAYAPYSNICPISGRTGANVTRTGVNLWGGEKMADDIVSAVGDATKAYKGTDSNGAYVVLTGNNAINNKILLKNCFKANTQYSIVVKAKKSNTNKWANLKIVYADGSSGNVPIVIQPSTTIESDTIYTAIFTSESGKSIDHIRSSFQSGTCYIYYDSFGVFEGIPTEDQFESYQGQTYEVTFPADPGIVYGGTLDVTTGVLTVDTALVTLDGTSSDGIYLYSASNGFRVNPNAISGIGMKSGSSLPGKCNLMPTVSASTAFGARFGIASNSIYLCQCSDIFGTTVEAFLTYLQSHNMQFAYPLATTQTYTLDPITVLTLLGVNNVWSDAGAVSVTYPADTQTYIDNRINATRKLIAGIETGFTASKAYSVGDMLIIGDDLYKVASSIASGATITVGTNVTKTTVAEQLLALANS